MRALNRCGILGGRGRGLLQPLSRLKTNSTTDMAACPKEQFYQKFADALLYRLWPMPLLNRWIRTLSLCGTDPTFIKLQLSRSVCRTNARNKWLPEVLWNIADNPETKDMSEISIPAKDIDSISTELSDMFIAVHRMHRTVSLLPDGPARSQDVSEKKCKELADNCCKAMPTEAVTDVIKILDDYLKESTSDEKFVADLVVSTTIHAKHLYPLFRYLSIPVDRKTKKQIQRYDAKREKILNAAYQEIKAFAESIPDMGTGTRQISKKNARSLSEWVSRPYGLEHCLAVSVKISANDWKEEDLTQQPKKPMKSTEQWFFPSRQQRFEENDKKIFLRNLPQNVTVEDIRLSFIGCDPHAANESLRLKLEKNTNSSTALQHIREHNLQFSPVRAVHLVKDDLDDVMYKFMYDLPRYHTPDFPLIDDVTDASGQDSSLTEESRSSKLDPDADMVTDDILEAPEQKKRKEYEMQTFSPTKVKTALISKQIPESYAFIVIDDPVAYKNALATDMRVLGVLIKESMVYTKSAEELKMLVFEINYNANLSAIKSVSDLDGALALLRNILSSQFTVGSPLWQEPSGGHGNRYTKRFSETDGPSQPAFLHLKFSSHDDAWRAYEIIATSKNSPGHVSWIFSKHYRWVVKQTDCFENVSTPMLVDNFFSKAENGGLKIDPDLQDEFDVY